MKGGRAAQKIDRSHLNAHFKTCEGSYAEAFDKMLEAGGEQFILSAVMHADERNRALSEQLGRDVFHYHLHVVYVPVVDKEIKWSKRCKAPALVDTTKEVIKQVSQSKKCPKLKQLDRNGKPVLSKNGKPVLVNSYSLLQDRFFEHMQTAGYTDFERGERGSTAAMLDSVTKETAATFSDIEGMTKKTIRGNVQLSPADWKPLSGIAKKGVTAEGDIADLKKQLTFGKTGAGAKTVL